MIVSTKNACILQISDYLVSYNNTNFIASSKMLTFQAKIDTFSIDNII